MNVGGRISTITVLYALSFCPTLCEFAKRLFAFIGLCYGFPSHIFYNCFSRYRSTLFVAPSDERTITFLCLSD